MDTRTWAFAAIMAAAAAACGGNPGPTGENPPGSASHVPQIVTFDVTVTPAIPALPNAQVLAATDYEDLSPWSTLAEYPSRPFTVDIAASDFDAAAIDIDLPGYVDNGDLDFVPDDLVGMGGSSVPAQFLVARDLTGTWSMTEYDVENGVPRMRYQDTEALEPGDWSEADGTLGYHLYGYNGGISLSGDTIVGGSRAGTTGTIAPDASTFTVEYPNAYLGLLRYEYVRQ